VFLVACLLQRLSSLQRYEKTVRASIIIIIIIIIIKLQLTE